MRKMIIIAAVLGILVGGTEARALDEEWAGFVVNGFLQNHLAVRTADAKDNDEIVASEQRFQLEISRDFEVRGNSFQLYLKNDFLLDEVELFNDPPHESLEPDNDLREAYAGYSWESLDFRIGRQIITWGIADRIFLNDVFPKSWNSFYTGRPLEYLKLGSDAAVVNYYPDWGDLELVAIPFFRPDDFPTKSDSLYYFKPMPLGFEYDEPDQIKDMQLGARFTKTIAEIELNLYTYRGNFTTPGTGLDFKTDATGQPAKLVYTFPRIQTAGFTAQRSLFDGIAGLETIYINSLDDSSGDDPYIENSRLKYLISYEKEAATDLTVGIQAYAEQLLQYDRYRDTIPDGFPVRHELTPFYTLNINQLLFNQTLALTLFTIYGSRDEEIYLKPEIKYNFTDNFWAALGANIFEGDRRFTRIGQFDNNDNLYVIARYQF